MVLLDSVRALPPIGRLVYWINERESIRVRRGLGLPPPWTDDPILRTYRFCNVRRMDDRVSCWLYNNWYEPHKDHHNSVAAAALARHYNLPSLLSQITELVYRDGPPLLSQVATVARAAKRRGEKIFNGAYIVRGIGAVDKTEMVVNRVVRPLVDAPPKLHPSSMQRSVEALLPYWGFSTFMAGQVVADLRWALTGTWADRHSWASVGPGSRRGMNRIMGMNLKTPLPEQQWSTMFSSVLSACQKALPAALTERLEAIDYQNCLCEFDKYERTLWGEGRPKQLYHRGN